MKNLILHYGRSKSDEFLLVPTTVIEYLDKDIVKCLRHLHDVQSQYKCVSVAANQIGFHYRMFVYLYGGFVRPVLNPFIISSSEETFSKLETCISDPEVTVIVPRKKSIVVKFVDFSTFEERIEEYSGERARIFQHEINHLDGKRIFDGYI